MCVKLGFQSGVEESHLEFNMTLKNYITSACEIRPGDGTFYLVFPMLVQILIFKCSLLRRLRVALRKVLRLYRDRYSVSRPSDSKRLPHRHLCNFSYIVHLLRTV